MRFRAHGVNRNSAVLEENSVRMDLRYAVDAMTDETAKDPAAQSMAEKRWAKTTKAQRSQVAKDLNAARWAGHVKAGAAPKVKAKKGAKKKAGK